MESLLPLGFLLLLLVNLVTIAAVLAHIRYILRMANRLSYLEGNTDLILETLSMQNNLLVTVMENK
jgi:hypothetical protein